MTQENKDLLLKDLSARLPYGVNVEYTFEVTVIATNAKEIWTKPLYIYSINTLDDMTVSGIDDDGDENICFFEEVKPYLRPMSSMTGDEILEYLSLKESIVASDDITYSFETPESINWLNKNMFDYRGLIPMGLAIDATDTNIY